MGKNARTHISETALAEVLNRARDDEDRICCAHCADPITDEQMLTIQHIVPRRRLTSDPFDMLATDLGIPRDQQQAYADRPETEQREFLQRILNSPDNLCPMHNACHREVDFGLSFTPEEAARINLKDPRQDNADELLALQALSTPYQSLEGAKLAGWILLSHRNELARTLRTVKTDMLQDCHAQLIAELTHFQDLEDSHEKPTLQVMHAKHEGCTHAGAIGEKLAILDSILAKRETARSVA